MRRGFPPGTGESYGILRYDVGVDANQFYPVSVNQIVDFFFGGKESVGEPSPDKQKGRKKLTPGKPPGIRQVWQEEKALLFHDQEAAEKILQTDHAAEVKIWTSYDF